MRKYKCPFCGAMFETIRGFIDITEYDEYIILDNGDEEWVKELDVFRDNIKFECVECNEVMSDINDFEIIEDDDILRNSMEE